DFFAKHLIKRLHPLLIAIAQPRKEPRVSAVDVGEPTRHCRKTEHFGSSIAAVTAADVAVLRHQERVGNAVDADALHERAEVWIGLVNGSIELVVFGGGHDCG